MYISQIFSKNARKSFFLNPSICGKSQDANKNKKIGEFVGPFCYCSFCYVEIRIRIRMFLLPLSVKDYRYIRCALCLVAGRKLIWVPHNESSLHFKRPSTQSGVTAISFVLSQLQRMTSPQNGGKDPHWLCFREILRLRNITYIIW